MDFYNRINLIVGGIQDVCTEESCPTMSGGKRLLYENNTELCVRDKVKK